MTRFLITILVFLGITLPASAQMACGKRGDILEKLSGKYSEAPVAMGLSNTGGVVEVLSSDEGGTWTIILTEPGGATCVVAAGEYWEVAQHLAGGRKI